MPDEKEVTALLPVKKRGHPPAHPLVRAILGAIISRMPIYDLRTQDDLAAKAHRSVSTWRGWLSGARPYPSLLDVDAFAQAVGARVGLVVHTPATDTVAGGFRMASDESKQIAAAIDGRDPAVRRSILEMVLRYLAYSDTSSPR